MSCEICLLDSAVDPTMWDCVGCSRKFHASCIGIPAQRNSLRKRDNKVDVLSFVMPCCSSCQTLVTLNFEVDSLVKQQAQLAENVHVNTEVIHRMNQQYKVDAMHEAVDRVEGLLAEIKKELTTSNGNAKGSRTADVLGDVKNHLTSLFNTSMEATKRRIEEYVNALTDDLSKELKTICSEVQSLSSLTIEMAGHCNDHNSSQPSHEACYGNDILNEVKSLAGAVNSLDNNISEIRTSSMKPSPSLMNELASTSKRKSKVTNTTSNFKKPSEGWRQLGSKNVWRSDWTEYDNRQQHRALQQKAKDKAQKRKKAKKHSYMNNCNRAPAKSSSQSIKTRNGTNQEKTNSFNNYNKTINKRRHNEAVSNYLPPDKELLAAAKVTFSRPPVENQRGIKFLRGETLNPYPIDDGEFPSRSTSNSNWALGPALRNSFSQHCSSCSCEKTCFRAT